MKRLVLVVTCAFVLPFAAYSQHTNKPTLVTPPPNPAESSNIASGVITELSGQTITLKTNAPNPVSFALGKSVQYVDKKGKKVNKQRVGLGSRVRVYFQGNEDTRTVTRIALEG